MGWYFSRISTWFGIEHINLKNVDLRESAFKMLNNVSLQFHFSTLTQMLLLIPIFASVINFISEKTQGHSI